MIFTFNKPRPPSLDPKDWQERFAWWPTEFSRLQDSSGAIQRSFVWLDFYETRRYYDPNLHDNYFTGDVVERRITPGGPTTFTLCEVYSGDMV